MLNWLFPIRFWVIRHNGLKRIVVVRQRFKPPVEEYTTIGMICLDGPFSTQEDAARSLAFWRQQYRRDEPAVVDEDFE